VALCPPHLHYVEPYAGSLAVLLAKDPEGVSEVANDIDGRLTNFWYCLMALRSFEEFRRRAEATPFCEQVWCAAREKISKPCEHPEVVCVNCGLAFFHLLPAILGRPAGHLRSTEPNKSAAGNE
jgi:DNA adenine methylase